MADNPMSAALAEIRERHRDIDCAAVAYLSAGDIPRLLSAVEAALKFHQPRQLYERAFDPKGNPRCGHSTETDPDVHYEGDDGEWYCVDLPGGVACSGCAESPDGEYAEWPCDEYTAILAALTGTGKADG